jgi:hypothetical protein
MLIYEARSAKHYVLHKPSKLPLGFEPIIPSSKGPQTHVIDHGTIGIGR